MQRANSLFRLFLIGLVATTGLLSGCKKSSGGSISVEMVSVTTSEPANVRLLFQIDTGNQEVIPPFAMSDIEIYEDNILLTSLESQAQIQDEPGEYVFSTLLLLDFSGSVLNDQDLDQLKDALSVFIDLVMPDTLETGFKVKEMGIYWFNGEEELHPLVDYTFYKDTLLTGISSIVDTMSTDFSTNLNGAVMQGVSLLETKLTDAEAEFSQSNILNMVLFTDGIDLAGRQTEEEALTVIDPLTNQYLLYTIGLGEDIDAGFLERVGRNGYEFAATSSEMNTAFLNTARQINRDYSSFVAVEYCSPKRSGTHIIQLRAYMEDKVGRFDADLDADGFAGGCVIE